jgi:hypothetical protein
LGDNRGAGPCQQDSSANDQWQSLNLHRPHRIRNSIEHTKSPSTGFAHQPEVNEARNGALGNYADKDALL